MASLICNMDADCEKLLVCKMELDCVKTLQFDTEVPLDSALVSLLSYLILCINYGSKCNLFTSEIRSGAAS